MSEKVFAVEYKCHNCTCKFEEDYESGIDVDENVCHGVVKRHPIKSPGFWDSLFGHQNNFQVFCPVCMNTEIKLLKRKCLRAK